MARSIRCGLRWAIRQFCAAVSFALLWLVTPSAFAEEATASLRAMPSWPTQEGRAYEAARVATGTAYIKCLLTTLRDDDELTASSTRQKCAAQGEQYATYLPAEKVDEILQRVAFQVKARAPAR